MTSSLCALSDQLIVIPQVDPAAKLCKLCWSESDHDDSCSHSRWMASFSALQTGLNGSGVHIWLANVTIVSTASLGLIETIENYSAPNSYEEDSQGAVEQN